MTTALIRLREFFSSEAVEKEFSLDDVAEVLKFAEDAEKAATETPPPPLVPEVSPETVANLAALEKRLEELSAANIQLENDLRAAQLSRDQQGGNVLRLQDELSAMKALKDEADAALAALREAAPPNWPAIRDGLIAMLKELK